VRQPGKTPADMGGEVTHRPILAMGATQKRGLIRRCRAAELTLLILSCCPRANAQSFTTKAIGQSNPAAGASNTITVTLVSDSALAAADGSAVTVSGLDAVVASSPITLLDAGDDGKTIFSDGTTQGKGAWEDGTLTLTVNSGASLEASTTYTFRFEITNPASATTSPTINIAASGTAAIASAAMTKPGTALHGVAHGADPLTVEVPSFSPKSIQQSTPMLGATNTLTVSLTANFNLATGSTVTITGLTGSQTADSASLTVSSTSSLLGTSGVWTQSTGQLVLTAASEGTASGTACVVTFTLTNTATAQSSPAVSVSAAIQEGSGNSVGSIVSAAMTKPGTALRGVANGADPLTVVEVPCSQSGSLPCTFGLCTFSINGSGVLDRTGDCPEQSGILWLTNQGITAFARDGVFNNMRACTELRLNDNQLNSLPGTIFNGLTGLKSLYLHGTPPLTVVEVPCSQSGSLPCTFGLCTFSINGSV
jgi:hypothetical protein